MTAGSVAKVLGAAATQPRLAAAAGLFAVAAWSEFLVRVILPALGQRHWPGYWAAARFALDGRMDDLYADAEAFGLAASEYGSVPDIFNPNAPIAVLPFLPFGLLPEMAARGLWLVLSLAAFGAAWIVLLRALKAPPVAALVATGLVPLYGPIRQDVARGQAYLVLLALMIVAALTALGVARRRRAVGWGAVVDGIAVGVAAVLKLPYGLAGWGVLALQGRRRSVVAGGVVVGLCVVGTLVAWGPDPWRDYLAQATGWRTRPEVAVTAFQTINGMLSHLFRYDPFWNPAPIANQPWLITPLWLAAAGLIGGGVVVAARSAPPRADPAALALLPLAAAMPATTLLAPIAEQYHYTLSWLSLVVAAAVLGRTAAGTRWWLPLGGAALLLGGPWRFNVPDVAGWAALLHYPRVYGAVLLWGLLVWLAIRTPSGPHVRNSSERPSS